MAERDTDTVVLRVEMNLTEQVRAHAASYFQQRLTNLDEIIKQEVERFDFEAEVREQVRIKLRAIAQHQANRIAWAKEKEIEQLLAAKERA